GRMLSRHPAWARGDGQNALVSHCPFAIAHQAGLFQRPAGVGGRLPCASMNHHHATAFNLASVVEHTASQTPEHVALTACGLHFTYAELEARASSVAAGLASLGIGAGDHVALSCPNIHWFPIAYFGILKTGAVVVPLNVLFKPREIAYHLHDSEAK